MKPVLIGIAGGTGSGKSTFTRRIQRAFPHQVTVMYLDSYYKAHDELTLEERRQLNYDHPDAYDIRLLIRDLRALKAGKAITAPTYDFADYNRKKETVRINPARVILIEGILTLHYPELRNLLDIKVYVDADADERILRRVIRDTRDRGRKLDNIVEQYLSTVKPMHYLYVEPTRCYADVIVNSGRNDVAFGLLRTHIASILRQRNERPQRPRVQQPNAPFDAAKQQKRRPPANRRTDAFSV